MSVYHAAPREHGTSAPGIWGVIAHERATAGALPAGAQSDVAKPVGATQRLTTGAGQA